MPVIVPVKAWADYRLSGTVYYIDGQPISGLGAVPLSNLSGWSRGALVVGNSTVWAAYAHPGAANRILTTDANDTVWSANTLSIAGNSTINGSLVGNMTGGGTVATGGFTLTVPATGTAALRDVANTFSEKITLSGSGRVTKYSWIPAEALQSAGTKPAAVGVNGNGYVVMNFADNAEKEIQCNLKVPDDADDTVDVTVCVGWSSPTADPGDDSKQARWIVTYLVTALGDATDAAGTAAAAVLASASTVADGFVLTEAATINIAADDVCIHLKILRDGDDATDTLGDVVELHGMALKYTANKLGT